MKHWWGKQMIIYMQQESKRWWVLCVTVLVVGVVGFKALCRWWDVTLSIHSASEKLFYLQVLHLAFTYHVYCINTCELSLVAQNQSMPWFWIRDFLFLLWENFHSDNNMYLFSFRVQFHISSVLSFSSHHAEIYTYSLQASLLFQQQCQPRA